MRHLAAFLLPFLARSEYFEALGWLPECSAEIADVSAKFSAWTKFFLNIGRHSEEKTLNFIERTFDQYSGYFWKMIDILGSVKCSQNHTFVVHSLPDHCLTVDRYFGMLLDPSMAVAQ